MRIIVVELLVSTMGGRCLASEAAPDKFSAGGQN